MQQDGSYAAGQEAAMAMILFPNHTIIHARRAGNVSHSVQAVTAPGDAARKAVVVISCGTEARNFSLLIAGSVAAGPASKG